MCKSSQLSLLQTPLTEPMPKRKFVSTNRCFLQPGKNHSNFSFDIGSTWVLDGINCHTLRLAPWERNVAKLHVLLLLLLLLHNSSLTYMRNFLVYSWSYIKINNFSRDKGKEWIIRERERAPFVIQIFHDRESKSLITSFLSFCLRDSSSTDFFPLGRSIQLQTKWRTECSLVSWSFFVSSVFFLSLSLSHTHTHTHGATPTLDSLSLSSVSVGGCVRMKDMDDNDKNKDDKNKRALAAERKTRGGCISIHP